MSEKSKKEYAEEVARLVGGEAREVGKANGITLVGVTLIVGNNTAVRPTIYLDKMYEDGMTVEECAREVKEVAERSKIEIPDISYIYDFGRVKDNLRLRLYHNSTNAEIFRSAKEYGFDDLIIIPYLEGIIPNGSARVTLSMIDIWGVTEDELFEEASKAKDYEILPLYKILMETMRLSEKDIDSSMQFPMFVVTNEQRCYGAFAVIALQDRLKTMFPSGYIVIPSSVHETIVLPRDSADIKTVDSMVKDVNDEYVCREEVLSNRAYIF